MTTSYHFIEHSHKIVGRTGFEQVTTSVSVQGAWLPGATNLPWAEVAVSPGESFWVLLLSLLLSATSQGAAG